MFRKVAIFIGCMANYSYTEVGDSLLYVLKKLEIDAFIEPRTVILVEGILIFVEKALRDLFDMKIYVDTDSDLRFIRRLQRDIDERGRTVQSVIDQYTSTVRPMHLEFVESSKRYADIIVPIGGLNTVALEMVIARLQSLLNGELPNGHGRRPVTD